MSFTSSALLLDEVSVRPKSKSAKVVYPDEFNSNASLIPANAEFVTRVLPKTSFTRQSIQVKMVSNGRRFPVDVVATEELPGKTLKDKASFLQAAYKAACEGLTVKFHKGIDVPDSASWWERDQAYKQLNDNGEPVMAGWSVAGPGYPDDGHGRDFVLAHKGMDRVRTAVALAAATEARRTLGWEQDLHRRTVTAVKYKL